MSLNLSSVSQKRTLESILAGRVTKRPKVEDTKELQEAAIQLLYRHQNISGLLSEVVIQRPSADTCVEKAQQKQTVSEFLPSALTGSLLLPVLKRQADKLGVSVVALSVRTVLKRLRMTCNDDDDYEAKEGNGVKRVLLTSCQRVQLCSLLLSARELLSLGAFCPKLFWQEYTKHQTQYKLEVAHHLYARDILSIKYILESDAEARVWMVAGLKSLCSRTSPQAQQEEVQVDEERDIQQAVLSSVVGVLVGSGFEENKGPAGPSRRTSVTCCSILDHMLCWLLDSLDMLQGQPCGEAALENWVQLLDASLCGTSASPEALRRFFMHSLTQTLTYKPRLKVSDAIAMQNEWSFTKTSRLLTVLFRKLAIVFSVEDLLIQLQQVLETHEVNWQNVLSFLSTLLVFNPNAQPCLREMLGKLLASAFESYDLENMITAFLLARQGALEGPSFFPSYSEWFKLSFGGHSSYHGSSKKSLVFLLKFLSDLVPFDPPQYLKVHLLHPPYTAVKHRSLLQEYVSLAKTRLADLKVSVEDMSMYEDVSGATGEPGKHQCQALQDVERALSLFTTTGRISATVMEASIFRRPYFLNRFLPALLTPRVLPLKADLKMTFIDALKKTEKIPAGQYSSYVEACQRQRQQNKKGTSCIEKYDGDDSDPLDGLNVQLKAFRRLVRVGEDGEFSAQLARISHTLGVIFPDRASGTDEQRVIKLHVDEPLTCKLHVKVVDSILRTFCQCLLDASSPPNRQSQWAARYVDVLLGHTELVSVLMHRLWDLFHNKGSSLTTSHLLGLAAIVVHLHASRTHSPLLQMMPIVVFRPHPLTEALSNALLCNTQDNMLFCVRTSVAAVCYGICRSNPLPLQELQDYIPTGLVKKLLYLVPRLLPEARRAPLSAPSPETLREPPPVDGGQEWDPRCWGGTAGTCVATWRNSALQLWRNPTFGQLAQLPQYRLSLSEWLAAELRVQRNEDFLSDQDRQEYQRWACMECYLSGPVEQGGCGGDMRALCTLILNAIMDQQEGSPQDLLSNRSLGRSSPRLQDTGTCLPDILSRLQELVYEMQLSGHRGKEEVRQLLFELLSVRCSSSDSQGIGRELRLQQTLHAWNRVLLALPAELLVVAVRNADQRWTLNFHSCIEHVNQYQRRLCSPAAVLPYHVTSHLLRGMLSASARCASSSTEVNRAWSGVPLRCPLLLVSTVHWWGRLSPMLTSVWQRLRDEDPLPELLKTIPDCLHWALVSQQAALSPLPEAPALLLAASLHLARGGQGGLQGKKGQAFRETLETLVQTKDKHCTQVLVFLLFLCVTDTLATVLYPEESGRLGSREMCTDLLTVLVDSQDWHLIFKIQPADQGPYQAVTMATLDEYTRLRSFAFYSVLLEQSPELLKRAVLCPGFLHTAVLCYAYLFKLFLDGHTPNINQMEPSQILDQARQFLLRTISQTRPTALSSSQYSQLESLCAELDPEVAAALSTHLGPAGLSQEMDFLL
ncbi:Fanconi anemia group A protein isoform X2 [Gadus morhua]|uniref:FA complementation group A n=1 Tax=Gadus morhua TaxID=8049 RepID=A0A8C5B6S1_GADMO|nr:Fanconi anemia group A protein isoform X2 [Gadus morhua]